MGKKVNLSKYRSIIITSVQTIFILLFAMAITIVQCGFSFKHFDWLTFSFNFVFATTMKAVYTSYAKTNELQTDQNIILLRNTIATDRKEIYDAKKNEEFKKPVEKRNKINKLNALIVKLDNEKVLNKELRDWAFNYKMAIEKNEDTIEFEKERSLESVKIDYEKIDASKLFTFGQSERIRKKKYTFNSTTASLNRAIVPTTASIIISILFGTISNESTINSGNVWLDFAGYLFSIGLGIWWGLNNGKNIIQEDYAEVLNNVSSLIREIKTEIL